MKTQESFGFQAELSLRLAPRERVHERVVVQIVLPLKEEIVGELHLTPQERGLDRIAKQLADILLPRGASSSSKGQDMSSMGGNRLAILLKTSKPIRRVQRSFFAERAVPPSAVPSACDTHGDALAAALPATFVVGSWHTVLAAGSQLRPQDRRWEKHPVPRAPPQDRP